VWNDGGTLKIVLSNTILVPTAAELTIIGYIPGIDDITPFVQNVNLVGQVPTAIQNALITPAVTTVTITGVVPTVLLPALITPAVTTVTITGVAPTITVA
jgi:hypothetical protein